MDARQGLTVLGRGVAATAAVKLYRASMLLLADLADAEGQRQTSLHGADDPLALVCAAAARCNRSAAASLDECAAVLDARVVADVHAAAAYVATATSSYAQDAVGSAAGSAGMADFANKMKAALERGHRQFESAARAGAPGSLPLVGQTLLDLDLDLARTRARHQGRYLFSEAPLFRAWQQCATRARAAFSRGCFRSCFCCCRC
jgi:hypothetical protein